LSYHYLDRRILGYFDHNQSQYCYI